jgi:hypothetical protein
MRRHESLTGAVHASANRVQAQLTTVPLLLLLLLVSRAGAHYVQGTARCVSAGRGIDRMCCGCSKRPLRCVWHGPARCALSWRQLLPARLASVSVSPLLVCSSLLIRQGIISTVNQFQISQALWTA